ncbi:MAG: phage tail protein, partial [Burkholderiaceae bacterium]
GMPVGKTLSESKHYQSESLRVRSLGLGDQASADAIKYAKAMQTYGTSTVQNLELVRDALTVFADEHHAEMVSPLLAKMKFANAAMYDAEQAGDHDRKFMDMLKVIELRGGLSSQQAFNRQANIVQQVLTATGGRVGPEEWLNVIKTGGLAAKGMKDDAFYYTMEPLVQEMGGFRVGTAMMSAYNNLYQGRTTRRTAQKLDELGLIGDPTKVKHDKAGQLSFLNPGALKGADLFRDNQFAWMEQVLLPQLEKKGITEKQGVLDAIGGIFSNRTASNLFGQMYLQREQIHKNMRLNQGADDIDALYGRARQSASGQELEAQAKLRDLQLELGTQILPLYARGLEAVTGWTKSITAFMREHSTVAKATIVTFGALAGVLLVLGPMMLAVAALVGPFAVLRFMLTSAGASGLSLMPVLHALGGAFRFAGTAALWLGRALLMNPIGLAVTAIAVAAYLIYRNWEPIKAFFTGLWQDVRTAFSGGIGAVGALLLDWSPLGLFYKAFAGVLRWFGIDLPAKFSEFGANILRGLVDGITGALGWVKESVTGVGTSVIGWFKEKLGIRSPSRVFAQFGDYLMQGLSIGMDRGEDGPLAQLGGLTRQLGQIGAGLAIGAATIPA